MTAPDLGPLPTVPFCAVQDAVSPRLAPILGQEPESPLFTAEQMRAYAMQEVAKERERCAKIVEEYHLRMLAAEIRK